MLVTYWYTWTSTCPNMHAYTLCTIDILTHIHWYTCTDNTVHVNSKCIILQHIHTHKGIHILSHSVLSKSWVGLWCTLPTTRKLLTCIYIHWYMHTKDTKYTNIHRPIYTHPWTYELQTHTWHGIPASRFWEPTEYFSQLAHCFLKT